MEISAIVNQLKIAKDFYYKGRPIMTDPDFDSLENKLRELDPANDYFKIVGAVVRGEKIKHTMPMGSLDQINDISEFNSWVAKHLLFESAFVLSDKLDGNSIVLHYDLDGVFEYAVTRGDGIEGLDITRHINRMLRRGTPPIPKVVGVSGPFDVRCEAIIKKSLFEQHVTGYKNPRNYVAGQLNRAVADEEFIEYVDIVAFDATFDARKIDTLQRLYSHGFNVVNYTYANNKQSIEMIGLENSLASRKENSEYELDGIVIDVDDVDTRNKLGFDNLNPVYARKFKVNVNFIETEVVDVDWNPSKNGYMKPRVQIEPVDLAGVTISFATGFNAKFIKDNVIGPGAVVQITRSGDVIPFIQKVISPANEPALPKNHEEYCYWTETGVDLVLRELPDESLIKQNAEFFSGIDAPLLKMGNVTALYEAGFTSIQSILGASEDDFVVVLGENGYKAYNGLVQKLQGIPEYVLAGSLPFFGRGVGRHKMKALAEAHGNISDLTYDKIVTTAGFDEITAVKIANSIPFYVDFLSNLPEYASVEVFVPVSGDLNGTVVCFTGIRSKELENVIESRGGKVASSITKEVTHLVAKDPNGKSTKLDKARKSGIEVISLQDAQERWG